jgi:arylsulfatase
MTAASVSPAEAAGVHKQQKPNIVYIMADNLGYGEIGFTAAASAATPRIDSLAKEGMRFLSMNAETQCTPSRSSVMTGRHAIRSGTYAVPFGGVPEGLTQWEITIAEALSDAGYATGHFGKWHLGSHDGRLPNDRPLARAVFHGTGRRHLCAVPDSLAWQDSRRTREQRDRPPC